MGISGTSAPHGGRLVPRSKAAPELEVSGTLVERLTMVSYPDDLFVVLTMRGADA